VAAHRLGPPPAHRTHLGAVFLGLVLIGLLSSVLIGVTRNAFHGNHLSAYAQVPAVQTAPEAPAAPPARAQPPAQRDLAAPDLDALSAKVAPGLVNINTQISYQNAQSAGTGIVLTATGEVLTNNHVINGATSIKVTDIGNGRTYKASVVGYDRTHDIAVLRMVGATGLSTSTIGDSSGVRLGDPIAAIGNAGGVGGQPTTSGGTVTSLNRSISPNDELTGSVERLSGLIEVAANVQPGDSGGPLVNNTGEVIGVDTAASASRRTGSSTGRGYAIPINSAMAIAREIRGGRGSSTVHVGPSAMLGVSVVTSPSVESDSGVASDAESVDATGQGVLVKGIQNGSPAAQAGLRRGDVLQAMDGTGLGSAGDLTDLMVQHHPGDRVTVQWVDSADQQHSAQLTLIPGPPS
jgi:S1-C subfamily serine protease